MNTRLTLLEAWFLFYAEHNGVCAKILEGLWEERQRSKFVRSNETVDGMKVLVA